jgi:hypothetical protein
MNIRFTLAIFIFIVQPTIAQNAIEYPVKVGEIPSQVLPNEAMYVSPVFKNGTVFLKDGTVTNMKLNYNFLLDEMHFIGNDNDTLAIAEPALIKYIVIDSMEFLFEKGYLTGLFTAGKYKLALRQQMIQLPDKTRSGYDIATGSSSITTYGSIGSRSQIYHLQVKKDVFFVQEKSYYVGAATGPFVKANKKGFYFLFEGKEISQFVKEHHVNFNKPEDLKALLQFCVE